MINLNGMHAHNAYAYHQSSIIIPHTSSLKGDVHLNYYLHYFSIPIFYLFQLLLFFILGILFELRMKNTF